jgi:hypothetical protein
MRTTEETRQLPCVSGRLLPNRVMPVPSDILDNEDDSLTWARGAADAALRAEASKDRKKAK